MGKTAILYLLLITIIQSAFLTKNQNIIKIIQNSKFQSVQKTTDEPANTQNNGKQKKVQSINTANGNSKATLDSKRWLPGNKRQQINDSISQVLNQQNNLLRHQQSFIHARNAQSRLLTSSEKGLVSSSSLLKGIAGVVSLFTGQTNQNQQKSDFAQQSNEQSDDSVDFQQQEEAEQTNQAEAAGPRQAGQQQQQQDDVEQNNQDDEDYKDQFQDYTQQYSRNYDPEQQSLRFNIFQKNSKRVDRHNGKRKYSYSLQENQFADLSQQQFHGKFLMQDPPQLPAIQAPPMSAPPDFQMKAVDWREKMSPAKHQGTCGSCWAFSVLGVMETMYRVEKDDPVEFSVQHLVDCCKSGCNGCRGGWPVSALQFMSTDGTAMGEDYPYISDKQDCKEGVNTVNFIDAENPYSQIKGPEVLAYALESSPVSIIADASTWDQFYKEGVFDQCPTDKFSYNHAVILVGVTEEGNWIVRNSWGTKWGDQGHIYFPPGNSCGIADMGVIPNFATYDMGLGLAAPPVPQ